MANSANKASQRTAIQSAILKIVKISNEEQGEKQDIARTSNLAYADKEQKIPLKNDLEITPLLTRRQSISSKKVIRNRAGEVIAWMRGLNSR